MPNPTTPARDHKPTPPAHNKPTPPAPQNKPTEKPAEIGNLGLPIKPAKPAEKPAIDWAALPPATPDTGIATGDKVDVEKEIPEVVRKDVEESLAKFLDKVKNAKEGARVEPVWLVKTLPSEEVAKEFTRLVKRYGKYRPAGQVTVRGGPVKKDPKVVRFCAKPYESRGPKTVKAADTDAAKK